MSGKSEWAPLRLTLVISADVPEPSTLSTGYSTIPLVPKMVSKLPELLILPTSTRLDDASSSMPPTRTAPLCPALSSTTEQPYSVGELLPLGVAMVMTPGVGPLGLKLVSRVAVPEPLLGGIRRSTTPTGPLDVVSSPTVMMLPVPGSRHRLVNL